MDIAAGLSVGSRGFLRVAVVALAAHAFVYRSFLPADGSHGYFGWYESLVGWLSLLALVLFAAVGVARLLGRDPRWLRAVVDEWQPNSRQTLAAGRLAALSVVFLITQETLERSIPARTLVLAQFSPTQWAIILAAAVAVAAAFASLARGYGALLRAVVESIATGRRQPARSAPSHPDVPAPRRHPLAAFRGLRAPPSLAG